MNTGYLLTVKPKAHSFHFDDEIGLAFSSTHVDLRQLHGQIISVVIGGKLCSAKLFVSQRVEEGRPPMVADATIYLLQLIPGVPDTQRLEIAWHHAQNFLSYLYAPTLIGHQSSYNDFQTYPNLSTDWTLPLVDLHFEGTKLVGLFKHPESLIHPKSEADGEILVDGKTVRSDLAFSLFQPGYAAQTTHIHVTIPGKCAIDVSEYRVLESNIAPGALHITSMLDEEQIFIISLFQKAIGTREIFSSYILLYQIVEFVIHLAPREKLGSHTRERLKSFLDQDQELAALADRIISAASRISKVSSQEQLLQGVNLLSRTTKFTHAYVEDFPLWRATRNRITHLRKSPRISEGEFVAAHNSLRAFCRELITAF